MVRARVERRDEGAGRDKRTRQEKRQLGHNRDTRLRSPICGALAGELMQNGQMSRCDTVAFCMTSFVISSIFTRFISLAY
jgi:hypothetical protein